MPNEIENSDLFLIIAPLGGSAEGSRFHADQNLFSCKIYRQEAWVDRFPIHLIAEFKKKHFLHRITNRPITAPTAFMVCFDSCDLVDSLPNL